MTLLDPGLPDDDDDHGNDRNQHTCTDDGEQQLKRSYEEFS